MLLYTGALTSKPYAFRSRPWELRSVQSLDIFDGVGSNIRIDFKESEIFRILPRKNSKINENWISDKIRFFYDGLNRQRLTKPFLKIHNKLFPQKWRVVLSKFSSILKVYSFEYSPSRIGILAGSSLDLESLYTLRLFSKNFGFSFLGFDRFLKIDLDNPNNYKFQMPISDFETTDSILFIGTNPKFEAPTLNLRFRKLFRKGKLSFTSIGGSFDSIFPIHRHGLSLKTFVNFIEGKDRLCKFFVEASSPTILLGSSFLQRNDAKSISILLKILSMNIFLVSHKTVKTNILYTDANIVGGLELGINPGMKSDLMKTKLLFSVGIDKVFNFETLSELFVTQSTHGDKTTKKNNLIFPSCAFTEKTATFYNVEGRPQRSHRAFLGPDLSREDWKIQSEGFKTLKRVVPYRHRSHLLAEISKLLPSSYFINQLPNQLNFLEFGKPNEVKIYDSFFKLSIEDFYMTSKLCHSSKIMAKASRFLRSYTTNYQLLDSLSSQ